MTYGKVAIEVSQPEPHHGGRDHYCPGDGFVSFDSRAINSRL